MGAILSIMKCSINVFIYGYSPKTIGLKASKTLVVIVPSFRRETYFEIGFGLGNVKTVESITLKSCFLELQKIELEYHIEKVFTLDESIMDWCGILNDYFTNSRSQSLQNALFKDKYFMRVFLQGIVDQPNFYEYKDLKENYSNMLAKPRKMASAYGIKNCNSYADVESITSKDDYVFEAIVDYDEMFTTDGYAIDGKIVRFFSHQYDNKIFEAIHNLSDEGHVLVYTNSYYWKDMALIDKLYRQSKKIIEIFCKDSVTAFHFEFFYNKAEQKIVFCEVGSRFGGGRIPQLIKDAFDCDVLGEYWKWQESTDTTTDFSDGVVLKPSCVAATFMALQIDGLIKNDINLSNDDVKEFVRYKTIGECSKKAQSVDELLYLCRFVAKDEDQMNVIIKELVNASKKMFD